MAVIEPGVTITNESERTFIVGARKLGGAGDIGIPSPSVLGPGEWIHVFTPPCGVVATIARSTRHTRRIPAADVLATLAEEAYGRDWEIELGRLAGKTNRQVRRWLAGETKIPGPVLAMVKAHVLMVRNGLPPDSAT